MMFEEEVEFERTFELYLSLPAELRQNIVNRMTPIDRYRFTRCSQLCQFEAKNSNNFIFGLELYFISSDHTTVHIMCGREGGHHNGFFLEFTKTAGKKVKNCKNQLYQKLWEDSLDDCADLVECGIQEFLNRIHLFRNSIKRVVVYHSTSSEAAGRLQNVDFGIERCEGLEDLRVYGPIDVQQILAKMRFPLKKLRIEEDEGNLRLLNGEQLYKLENQLLWFNATFNNEQFRRLSAQDVLISIGRMTETDIFHFIRAWQNGKLGREIRIYRWVLRDSNFNGKKFFKLIRGVLHENEPVELRHYKDPSKIATLSLVRSTLTFNTGFEDIIEL